MRTTISEETIERLERYAREKMSVARYWGIERKVYLVTERGENRHENTVTVEKVIQQLLKKEGY